MQHDNRLPLINIWNKGCSLRSFLRLVCPDSISQRRWKVNLSTVFSIAACCLVLQSPSVTSPVFNLLWVSALMSGHVNRYRDSAFCSFLLYGNERFLKTLTHTVFVTLRHLHSIICIGDSYDLWLRAEAAQWTLALKLSIKSKFLHFETSARILSAEYLLQPGEQSIFTEPPARHARGGFLAGCGCYWGKRPQSHAVIDMHQVRCSSTDRPVCPVNVILGHL